MLQEHKLQILFRVFDDSLESTVLSYVRDRSQLTAASARENVLQALVAWLAVDALEANRSLISDEDFVQQLAKALALLKGRVAYCQSLLNYVGGIPDSQHVAINLPAQNIPPLATKSEAAESASDPDEDDSSFIGFFDESVETSPQRRNISQERMDAAENIFADF